MKLWAYGVDQGRWGQMLVAAASERGMDAEVFTHPTQLRMMREGDYVFMRVPQWEPELSAGRQLAWRVETETGATLIPPWPLIFEYEDKARQCEALRAYVRTHLARGVTRTKRGKEGGTRDLSSESASRAYMPLTYVHTSYDRKAEVRASINTLGLPFVSKAKEGSSSVNVRLIESVEDAMAEFETAMTFGISTRVGKGRCGLQRGYVLWQRFIPGNKGDIRICINGDYAIMLERDNAHGVPFASGSGRNRPINNPNTRQLEALDTADRYFKLRQFKWCGIDMVYEEAENKWWVLETTLGWSLKAYEDCRYFHLPTLSPTECRGADWCRVFLNQLENGVFAP